MPKRNFGKGFHDHWDSWNE